MVTNEHFREIAMSFPDTLEFPHFEKASFRIKKKIFATLSEAERIANVKLSPEEQHIFCAADENIVYPVPNKWGQQGWTSINLSSIDKELLREILTKSYSEVSGSKYKIETKKLN